MATKNPARCCCNDSAYCDECFDRMNDKLDKENDESDTDRILYQYGRFLIG